MSRKLLAVAVLFILATSAVPVWHMLSEYNTRLHPKTVTREMDYGERWIDTDGNGKRDTYVGMKYNKQTQKWVVIQRFTPNIEETRRGGK